MSFIKLTREELYGWKEDTYEATRCELPDPLTAICWTHGDSVQLNAIIEEDQYELDEQLTIITNTHSISRTAVEQPYDMYPCFMSFRKLANVITRVTSLQLVYK